MQDSVAVIAFVAFALLVGVMAGTYSSIYIASAVLITWDKRKRAKAA